ncbi:hypothetical protein SRABI96_00574 [Peribacillus sp. Bi96]|uniref:hypothetical protein n=1 Tax=unclassified Peribacillus TaxID=2675266 RepID=UPI001D60240B|nr:hypothetical protein [Peribacillus sp. Bi96]CAH0145449.1 hypothetical protein SRABI96_00574 [Peribacillus sp. Bi96]
MKHLSLTQKKWWLTAHILFSAIWLGVTVTFLILSISVLMTKDIGTIKAYYLSMLQLEQTAGRVSIIGTVITGFFLSILTKWGLLKFYWIIFKEIITLICMALGFLFIYFWTLKGLNDYKFLSDAFFVNHYQLMTGIALQIILLTTLFIISVFKPWGQRVQKK